MATSAAGQSTPEYVALRKTYTSLVDEFSTHGRSICGLLFEKSLVSLSLLQDVIDDAISRDEKAMKIVNTLVSQVEYDGRAYHTFMRILKNQGVWADSLVKQLEQAFELEHARRDHSVARHQRVVPDPGPPARVSVKPKVNLVSEFNKNMTSSELCEWLDVLGLPETVKSLMKVQDVDGESFLQLSSLSKDELYKELECKLTYGAYYKLKKALSQAVDTNKAHENGKRENISGHKNICPYCKRCNLMHYFSRAGCPYDHDREPLFPYLDDRLLTKNDRLMIECRLNDDARKMIWFYADTEDSILKSLMDQEVEVTLLISFVESVLKKCGKAEDIETLRESTTVARVFCALQPYKSFFHFQMLEKITERFGNEKAHRKMEGYLSKFNTFCKRTVFEAPPNIFHERRPKPGDKVLSVKFTGAKQIYLGDVVALRRKLADLLLIEEFALRLCCIRGGCVRLKFVISAHVVEKIFPLSPSQIGALRDMHIRIQDGPHPLEQKTQFTGDEARIVEDFEFFKSRIEEAVQISAPLPEQSMQFIGACQNGDIDRLLKICLYYLQLEGEVATELAAIALKEVSDGNIIFASHLVRESGIDMDERDEEVGGTALYWASRYGHTRIVEVLLECNTPLNMQTKDGWTALDAATHFQGADSEVVQILTKAGASSSKQLCLEFEAATPLDSLPPQESKMSTDSTEQLTKPTDQPNIQKLCYHLGENEKEKSPSPL